MSLKNYWILVLLLCAIVFSWSLYRDIQAEKQYTGDLRNRVVGARLQKDGLSPYFYKWKKEDGLRYYDPSNFDSLQVSNITGSPFFHRLFYPVAELPQKTISVYWLIAEYIMFVVIILLGLSLAVNDQQKWMVLMAACLFLLTEAWKLHTANGQNYVCIPVLSLSFYCSINKQSSLLNAFIAGCLAIILLLIKPTAILFFIPFLLVVKRYPKSWIGVFILPAIITCLLTVSSSKEAALCKQYKEGITEQIKVHQQESPVTQINEPDPLYPAWEGIDRGEIQRQAILHPMHIYSENGNFFCFF